MCVFKETPTKTKDRNNLEANGVATFGANITIATIAVCIQHLSFKDWSALSGRMPDAEALTIAWEFGHSVSGYDISKVDYEQRSIKYTHMHAYVIHIP